jgi:putative ABC transport system substrate-binding protein
MRRREFIKLIAGSAVAWPPMVRAQQPGIVYRIGFLANDPTIPTQPAGQAFLDELRGSGFVEGKNLVIERRFAEGRLDRYRDLAIELATLGLNVIVSSTVEATAAVKRATSTIPVVMLNVEDPVGFGLVASLAHPGGNITGVAQDDSVEIAAKRMQLLKEVIPGVSRVAVLMDPDLRYARAQWRQLEQAAPSLDLQLRQLVARRADEFAGVLSQTGRDQTGALFVTPSGLNFVNRKLIMELAVKSRLPAMAGSRESTEAGGLISYGYQRTDHFRQAAVYVSKILKGASPADLPVEEPIKYELVINLNTARALNLEIPRSLLLIADEVIE